MISIYFDLSSKADSVILIVVIVMVSKFTQSDDLSKNQDLLNANLSNNTAKDIRSGDLAEITSEDPPSANLAENTAEDQPSADVPEIAAEDIPNAKYDPLRNIIMP